MLTKNNSKDKYIVIGSKIAIESEAKFEKEKIYASDDGIHFCPKHFGLYKCFTVMTQHTYGTPEELLFILGVMSKHKDEMETNTHEFYKTLTDKREMAYAMSEEDTLKEMKRIGSIYGVEVDSETYREAYEKYFNHTKNFMGDNYFYHYRIGKALLHECEIVSGVVLL